VPTTLTPYQREFKHFRRKIMKFRPLHDRVVVKRLEEELKTKGGIIIPDTAAEKPRSGQVVAAGPGARGEDGKLQPMG
jgi:chaperonin GroES